MDARITSIFDDADADREGVRRFAEALLQKLAEKRAQGYSGWNDPADCSIKRLEKLLAEHISKGDPVDIGNFCMMIWNRRNPTAYRTTHGR